MKNETLLSNQINQILVNEQILLPSEVVQKIITPNVQGAWYLLGINYPHGIFFLLLLLFWAGRNFFWYHQVTTSVWQLIIALFIVIYLASRKPRCHKQLLRTFYIFTNLRCIIYREFPRKNIRIIHFSKTTHWEFYQNSIDKLLKIYSLFLGHSIDKSFSDNVSKERLRDANAEGTVPFISQTDKEQLSLFLENRLSNTAFVSAEISSDAAIPLSSHQFIPECFDVQRSKKYFFKLMLNYIKIYLIMTFVILLLSVQIMTQKILQYFASHIVQYFHAYGERGVIYLGIGLLTLSALTAYILIHSSVLDIIIDGKYVKFSSGLFFVLKRNIAIEDITQCELKQSFFEHWLGINSLIIEVKNPEKARFMRPIKSSFIISGLEKEQAELILKKITQ